MDPTTRNFLLLKLAEVLGVIAVIMIAGAGRALNYRPVEFKYPQREGRASLVVYLLALAAAVFAPLVGARDLPQDTQALLARQLVVALIALVIAVLALVYRRQPPLSAGWGRRDNLRLGLRIGLLLVLLSIFLRGKTMAIVDGVSGQEGLFLLFLLLSALAEESVFRGYLQLRFISWLGKPNGWLATSALFVVWSLPRLFLYPQELWISLAVLVVQSFLLGWLMDRTGHVLAPALYRAVSDWLTLL